MVVVRAVGRFLVATAAGAGVGAGAALYRKHLLNEDANAEVVSDVWQETEGEALSTPEPAPAPAAIRTVPADAPAAAAVTATPQDLAALQASVADLEAARARLRERAAALRAEMEESSR
jgi:hypothetical protein